MPIDVSGIPEVLTDINNMANKLDTNGSAGPVTKRLLQAAAVPVESRMKAIASSDPAIISGDLHNAIGTGPVKKKSGKNHHITVGVHRKDWHDEKDYYPAYVEYGHGGPAPAPAHPYIRPASDSTQDQAYEIIREGLREALK